MSYVKIVTYIIITSSVLSSCELFGGGNKKDEKVAGGEMVWKVENAEELTVSTQPAIEDGRVYVIQNANLRAFVLKTGKHLWSNQICDSGRDCDYTRKIILDEAKIYYDQGYDILAVDKTDGSLIWETDVTSNGDEVSGIGAPIMSQDENYLYAGRKGYVVKLRKSDGQIVRKYPLNRLVPEGVIQGSTEPIISPFGDNILYIPTAYYNFSTGKFGGNIFAFEAGTGELIWEKHLKFKVPNPITEEPADSGFVHPPIEDIALTESSIVALAGREVVVLNRFTGEIRWFKYDGFDVGLAVKNGSIYAVSLGSGPSHPPQAYRLDLQTGEIIWHTNVEYSNTSIPTVKNGRLYFVNSGGGAIWVLDTKDGSVIYRELPPGFKNDNFDVYISSLAVGDGYMVDVGSQAVYCLTVP